MNGEKEMWKNFFIRCVSGITGKDFIPPVFFKLCTKARNFFHLNPKTTRIEHLRYLPEDYVPSYAVDVGAATGFTAKFTLDAFPSVAVYCFEPVRTSFERMKLTLHDYEGRTNLYNLAVSDEDGETEILLFSSLYANSLKPMSDRYRQDNPDIHETGRQKVEMIRLDTFRKNFPAGGNAFVKIDVEGLESAVLRGGETFFREDVSCVIAELSFNRDADQARNVMRLLNGYGFRLFNVFDVCHGKQGELVQMDAVYMKHTNP